IAPSESVDRILTFRNVHNWTQAGAATEVFKAMYKALKPGGILGVVEHRGSSSTTNGSGYVPEQTVIELAEKAGFQLIAQSELNANPKDSKNHPKGVWTLPPTLRMKEVNRDRYLAIGESDRMTLKFLKP
ncbi:MAG: methyltransferase, partial [Gammaproteobacteria bacterium]